MGETTEWPRWDKACQLGCSRHETWDRIRRDVYEPQNLWTKTEVNNGGCFVGNKARPQRPAFPAKSLCSYNNPCSLSARPSSYSFPPPTVFVPELHSTAAPAAVDSPYPLPTPPAPPNPISLPLCETRISPLFAIPTQPPLRIHPVG